MNDFFTAFNRTITLHIFDQDIEVRQITMKDFDSWMMWADKVKEALGTKSHSDLIALAEILKSNAVECCQMCSLVTGLEQHVLFDAVEKNPADMLKLLNVVLQVNQAFFKQKKRKKKKSEYEETGTWFDSFQYLIAAGHSHSDIMNMTYGAYVEYLKSAQKLERQRIAVMSNAVRAAHHAAAKQFKDYISKLNKVDD